MAMALENQQGIQVALLAPTTYCLFYTLSESYFPLIVLRATIQIAHLQTSTFCSQLTG